MRRGLLPLIAGIAAAAAWPGAAVAATARVDEFDPDYGGCKAYCPDPTFEVVLVANRGERNDVTATRDPNGAVVLHDGGAPIAPKRGCTAIDANTVSCGDEQSTLRVTVRDGDDTVRIVDGYATVEGGAGADHLYGGPEGDTLVGGPGADFLQGGAGDDRLIDGVARPRAGGGNDDVFDGGAGTDWVDYTGRLFPIQVDLGAGLARMRAGERDSITGIENAMGGTANDTILGDDANNELDGGAGAGADVVKGGAGADTLWTASGDRTFGGDGRDWIRTNSSRESPHPGTALQRVDCGADVDFVEEASIYTVLDDSCELTSAIGDTIRLHLPLRSFDDPVLTYEHYTDESTGPYIDPRHIEVRVSGVAAFKRHPPRGTLLAVGDTGYAKSSDVRLTAAGAKLLHRYGRIRARVSVRDLPLGYMIDLRAPAVGSP
jgi:Ca2+-binding RTX toxin-like protein